ncbi:MAG: 5'-methylthioadenosine/adenosylhomocysteine nucleosidase [Angelakisella sp.]
MKIGIMCAIQRELAPIAAMLQNHKTETLMQRTFHTGILHGVEVVAVIGGVGKVNGAMTAQLLCERFGIERLIFTGVAGGLCDSLKVGDIVIGTTLLYHDIAMSFVSNEMFDTPNSGFYSDNDMVELCRKMGGGLRFGTIITGDQFITGAQRDRLVEEFHPLCVDMESAAVAQVCWFYKLPLLIIRCISDFADDDAEDTFESNAEATGLSALAVMEKVIQSL